MLLDHIGVGLYPENIYLRMIGRMAMPLYAYGVAAGYNHTKADTGRFQKYRDRMLVLALVSQIPYRLLIHDGTLNICVVWYLSLLCLSLLEQMRDRRDMKIVVQLLCLTSLILFVPMDYGWFAVLYVVTFDQFIRQGDEMKAGLQLTAINLLNIFYVGVKYPAGVWWSVVEMISILALPLISAARKHPRAVNREHQSKTRLKQWKLVKYSFYPAHLLLIYSIRLLMH